MMTITQRKRYSINVKRTYTMNKAVLEAIIAVLVIVGSVVGVLIYLQSQTPAPSTSNNGGTNTNTPQEGAVSVEIKSFAFAPSKIIVKKGTTVTWTNQDTTKHNVVATSASNTGGLSTDSPLLAKGESFS